MKIFTYSAKGAAIVNCDFIAHDLYKPGLPLNQTIAETFGTHVIAENGDVDRKKLGSIVFGDKVGNLLIKVNVGIQHLIDSILFPTYTLGTYIGMYKHLQLVWTLCGVSR